MKIFFSFLLTIFVSQFLISQNLNSLVKQEYLEFNLTNINLNARSLNQSEFIEEILFSQSNNIEKIVSKKIAIPLTDADPFLAISFHLYHNFLSQDNFEIEFSYSRDDLTWSEWIHIHIDNHGDIEKNKIYGNLLFIEKEAKFLKWKIKINQAEKFEIEKLKLFFISPGATPTQLMEKVKNFPKEQKQIQLEGLTLDYPRPNFIDRVGWGCPWPVGNPSNPNWRPSETTVSHLVVHHSAGSTTSSDFPAVVRSYWSLHVNSNGWSDIGYNWLVDGNGVLYQGRQWNGTNEDVVGAHFSGVNWNTMGICVIGDYTMWGPTESALRMLVRMLGYKADQRNINVRGVSIHNSSGMNLSNICGHRDGPGATACPGAVLYSLLPNIRNRVFALLNPPEIISHSIHIVRPTSVAISANVNPRTSVTRVWIEYGLDSINTRATRVDTIADSASAQIAIINVDSLTTNIRYFYRVVASNSDTTVFTNYSTLYTLSGSTDDDGLAELKFQLNQNYPNPFNPSTVISWDLPEKSFVILKVYDLLGTEILTLVESEMGVGSHRYNFENQKLKLPLASGFYFYRLTASPLNSAKENYFSETKKMILLK
ncbi:MAG: hypothetical protein C0425_07235, partial [Chlorobiaceae bacterium]|nr:hypothetical protein [Chlorobiaceae bacterium]MBA4310117.1 hypothetical protein [Chlorobiaceae bacterium]